MAVMNHLKGPEGRGTVEVCFVIWLMPVVLGAHPGRKSAVWGVVGGETKK
jgi:hypothetical protein